MYITGWLFIVCTHKLLLYIYYHTDNYYCQIINIFFNINFIKYAYITLYKGNIYYIYILLF